jgi:carboxyl-terminal processing protease
LPLTVLVDGNTASSAEVTAAALRDYDRALLVGTTTYGKGVVQRVVTLSKDLSVRLTTARWLTPKGITLDRRTGNGALAKGGLHPDVLLDDATRRDAFAVPREWAPAAATQVMRTADSLAMYALREGWSITPLALLEARLRTTLAQWAPWSVRDPVARAEWVTVSTRLTLVRILEVEREGEALLRYAVREDAALRAGIDVVAPGTQVARVLPAMLP